MKTHESIGLALLFFSIAFSSAPARAQEPSAAASLTECKPGRSVPGYKHPGFELRPYTHFVCGSSVYVWRATSKTALVQQGSTVAYVAAKYIPGASTNDDQARSDERVFLQAIAQALQSPNTSAALTRLQIVESCLRTQGCRVDSWSHLAWTRIKSPSELVASDDSTLRLYAHGIYYSAFVVDPPVRFRDQPLPSVKSPVLVLDGGGLSLAVVGHVCYTYRSDGKWAAAGASAVQTAAIQ
jgi:hypothetical protein